MAMLASRLLMAAAGKAINAARVTCRQPISVSRRFISVTSSAYYKIFLDLENNYAHSTLRAREELQSTLVSLDCNPPPVTGAEFQNVVNCDWTQASPEDVAKAFEIVSHYGPEQSLSIADSMFDGICDAVKSKCKDMQDDDLFRVLRALALWGPGAESVEAKNFIMWKDLDEACCERCKLWKRRTLLYAADHWYHLKIVRASKFMYMCNRKLARKPSNLSPYELVQAMFYLNIFRKHSSIADMYEYEYCFHKTLDKMNIDEIAIFAMGFFKSQTKMKNEALMSSIIDRTMESASTVESVPLAAILKSLRYCVRLNLADKLWALLETLQKEVPRVSVLTCIHIALLGTNTQVFHEGAFKTVCERLTKEISALRAKDLERLAMALVLFNYDPKTTPCIFKRMAEELQNPERAKEFKQHPKCVSRSLYYLSQRNIFLPDLTAHVLDPDFLKETYGKDRYMTDLEVLGLDVAVELEFPSYSGPRLEERTRHIVSKRYKSYMPDNLKRNTPIADKMLRDIYDAAVLATGSSSRVRAIHLLPQYARANVVFRLGPSGRPMEIPQEFKEDRVGCVVRPVGGAPDDCWCAIFVGVPNAFVRESDHPIGTTAANIRQLKLIGYNVIVVPWYDWIRLSEEGRAPYIKNILESLTQ